MPVTLRYHLDIGLSSTPCEDQDLGHFIAEIVSSALGEGGIFKTTLAAGAVDMPIALDNIANVSFLLLKVNTVDATLPLPSILVRRNLITAEQIEVAPLTGAKESIFFLTTNNLTGLFVSNTAMTALELTIAMAGD